MENVSAACPTCDGQVTIPSGTEVSEILTCTECSNRVVVESVNGSTVTLAQAPEVEEDWGE